MIWKKIIIRPTEDFTIFSLILLISYYLPFPYPLFILVLGIFWRLVIRRSVFFLILGVIFGLFLQGLVFYSQHISYSGLPVEIVESVTVQVSRDSFLSSKGNRIVKARLKSVKGKLGVECEAEGDVLLIGTFPNEVCYIGELISLPCSLSNMDDSREFSFIGFAGDFFREEGWSSGFYRFRKKIIEHFDAKTSFMNPPVKALFLALFRGNSDYLSSELKDNFRKGGVPHLLALSGFHVAIVVLLFTMLIKPLTGYKIAALTALPLLCTYLFFAGTSPSLVRAVLMFSLAAFFRLINRTVSPITLLFLTAFIQLLINPIGGWSLSFQLSYLALGGLIIPGKRIESTLEPYFPSFLSMPLSASIGAHLFTVPLLLIFFGEVFPAGLISSLFITPLIVLFMWSSLASYILVLLPIGAIPARMLNYFNLQLVNLIEKIVAIFARIPSIPFSLSIGTVIYFILIVLVVLYLYRSMWRHYGRKEKTQFKLRFPVGNQSLIGVDGSGTPEKMEPEFPH